MRKNEVGIGHCSLFRFKAVIDFPLGRGFFGTLSPGSRKRLQAGLDTGCAGSIAGVAFARSVFRWRDVFGDVPMDMVRRRASSKRWSILGNQWEWGPYTDLRVQS